MIEREKDVVERPLLGTGLHEAREHLDSPIRDMSSPDFDEVSSGCQLSHMFRLRFIIEPCGEAELCHPASPPVR
jgi:hypothetical protein